MDDFVGLTVRAFVALLYLATAAAQAGYPQYHAVAMIGDAPPVAFTS